MEACLKLVGVLGRSIDLGGLADLHMICGPPTFGGDTPGNFLVGYQLLLLHLMSVHPTCGPMDPCEVNMSAWEETQFDPRVENDFERCHMDHASLDKLGHYYRLIFHYRHFHCCRDRGDGVILPPLVGPIARPPKEENRQFKLLPPMG
jgi:hypothetical protein